MSRQKKVHPKLGLINEIKNKDLEKTKFRQKNKKKKPFCIMHTVPEWEPSPYGEWYDKIFNPKPAGTVEVWGRYPTLKAAEQALVICNNKYPDQDYWIEKTNQE
jgi:hypothetical protein